eukprot:TRINITY_DN24980_c0_g1_i1.p2 TRINITY_DN24980_c0_g1~~TRINITY_DN24980_c0_g1_i1.p2  ORF type:complete len:294 (+),score=64.65 TRINITY_DN24980_c0_g1_i1:98-979(+)
MPLAGIESLLTGACGASPLLPGVGGGRRASSCLDVAAGLSSAGDLPHAAAVATSPLMPAPLGRRGAASAAATAAFDAAAFGGARGARRSRSSAFLGSSSSASPASFFSLSPPKPPVCLPPNTCEWGPLFFQGVKFFNKGLWPVGSCINTDDRGILLNGGESGFTVEDPRIIVWEYSPSCSFGQVRIHYVDGEGSSGINNKPEAEIMDAGSHTYQALKFITISDKARREMKDAMIHRRCTLSPLLRMYSELNIGNIIANNGGPDFLKPQYFFMPSDANDMLTWTVKNKDAGDEC